jgi:hypothetical protein
MGAIIPAEYCRRAAIDSLFGGMAPVLAVALGAGDAMVGDFSMVAAAGFTGAGGRCRRVGGRDRGVGELVPRAERGAWRLFRQNIVV